MRSRRFNQLVTQTEMLVRKIESTRLATDAHRALHAAWLKEQQELMQVDFDPMDFF